MKFLNHNLFTGDITVNGTTTLSTATGITRATGDNSTHLATTAFVKAQGYATTAALSGYVPITRTITINGTTLDLSADRAWTINAAETDTLATVTTRGNTTTNTIDVGGVKSDYLLLDTAATPNISEGMIRWNSTDGTAEIGLKYGDVVLQLGQEQHYVVRNSTGSTILNGTAVYASGVTEGSGRIEAAPYVADGSIREVRFLGLATHNISNGVNGVVTHFGYVRELDTRGTAATAISVGNENWSVGDILYVHPTVAGKLTNVKPKHEIIVAIIINRHQSSGVLFVRPSSAGHLDDIHDVILNSESDGQLLKYDSIAGAWVNWTPNFLTAETDTLQSVTNRGSSTTTTMSTNGGKLVFRDDSIENHVTNGNAAIAFNYYGYGTGFTQFRDSIFYNGKGSAVMFVDGSSSNVGIGTTSPAVKLHALGSSTTELRLQNSDANNNYGFVKYETSVAGVGGNLVIGTNASGGGYGAMLFIADNNIDFLGGGDLRIVKSGNVGIGTYSPNEKLHVTGNIHAYAPSGIDAGLFASQAAGSTTIAIRSNGVTHFNGGNVGIGTTSPDSLLQIGESYQTTAGTNKKIIVNIGGYYSTGSGIQYQVLGFTGTTFDESDIFTQTGGETSKNFYIGIVSDGGYFNANRFSIIGNGAERLTVKPDSGNVGIGTTAPAAKLHVNPSTTNEIAIAINGTQNYSANQFQRISAGDGSSLNRVAIGFGYNSTPEWTIRYSSYHNHEFFTGNDWGSSTEKMRITSAGNVGIGTTSPTSPGGFTKIVHINGGYASLVLTSTIPNKTWEIGINSSSLLTFYDGVADRLVINASGNVGIGTTNPAYKLDINGETRLGKLITTWSNSPITPSAVMYSETGYNTVIGGNGQFSTSYLALMTTGNMVYSGGNVGINTTAPTAKLHVEGPSGDGTPVFRVNGTTAPNSFNYAGSLMNSDLGSSRNTILLIGKAQSNRDSGYIGFNHSGTNGSNSNFLTFGLFQNDNIMNITGAGNVGIGTTSPGTKLDVNGVITATGGNSTNWNTAYSWGNHASQGYATQTYVNTAISNLVDSAPDALDTLNELAAALGDDPNFATTVTNSIAGKVSKSGDTMTGNLNWTSTELGLVWTMNTDGAYIKFFNTGDGDTNSRLEYGTSDNGNEFHRWMVSTVEEMTLKSDGLRVTDSIWMGGNLVATQSWVTSQNYLTSVPDEYLTETEGNALYAPISHTHSAADITSGTLASARLSGTYAISVSGSAATLTTARTLTIGSTGKTFNGSANVSWTLAEIGAAASSHTQPISTITGIIEGTTFNGTYPVMFSIDGNTRIFTHSSITYAGATNTLTAPNFSGALTGNATTATTLATARTLTIGNTGKTFNGSANVSWSLAEIGAYAATNPAGYTTNTGTVTSVSGTGGYGGLTLSGTVTSSGNITLGGTPTGTWPISVSGNAATATSATSATSATQVVTLQDDPPAGVNGKLWWETDTGKLKVYYGASSAWVDALPMPDMTLYLSTAGGAISGDLSIAQTLTVTGNILSSAVITATGGNSTQWNTAYGWGNHASAGYLTSFTESDPTVPAHVKSITTTEKSNWNTAYSWGNHAGLYLGITAKAADSNLLDGIDSGSFLRSDVADTATGEILFDAGFKSDAILLNGAQNFDNISRSGFYNLYNANTGSTNSPGFPYGTMVVVGSNKDGATFGFQLAHERLNTAGGFRVRGMNDTGSAWSAWATVWTSQDFANNSGNWNTAFGWGNHASAGYQAAATAITTSNIGSQSVSVARQLLSPNDATVVAADSAMPSAGHSFIHTLALGPGGNDGHILGMTWAGTTSVYGAQIFIDTDPTSTMAFRSRSSTGVWTAWTNLVHSGNIGSQSVSYATTAGALTSMNISQFTNNSGYLTAESDTLATVTGRGATTTSPIIVTASEGREVAVYMPSSYTTDDLVSGHEYGWYSDHWRLGMTRSGNTAGADFVVQWNGARRLSLTNGGNLTVTGTIGATNFSGTSSGTNTGDQTNITGNSGTATALQTGRTLTIGSTGKTFDGTGNVSWTLGEIGAQAAGSYVIANGTSAGNIDSDWGQSFKTFDPVPSGTPPIASPNIRTINVGEDFNRRTQLAFDYASDVAYFRRRTETGWQTWREFIHSGNIGSQSVNYAASAGNADTLDTYHETAFVRLAASSSSPTNGAFAIGSAGGRNFIQSHSGQPLDINPLGNAVTIGTDLTVDAYLTVGRAMTDPSRTRMFMPGGGSYVTTTSVVNGAIRIKLPTQGSGMMMTCTVKVYEYSVNKSFTITFGGHRDSANWYNEFCYIDGDKSRGNLTVRFGVSGGKDCVWIGENDSSWSYPQVFVTDFQLGYVGYSPSWATGWEIAFTGSFDTINRTQTAYAKITGENIGSQSVSYATSAGSASSATTSSNVTVNSGNTSAAWYPIVWHSGNTLYSSSGTTEIYPSGGYIRSSYINTTDNDETGITRFVIKNTDNYHRSATTTTAANIIRGVASGTWGIDITGNAATSTTFSTGRTNYKGVTDGAVAGQLMWKNYGNNHTIFDASNSTSPSGTSVNNTNSQVAWTGTYPTLMGWNGSETYGVRVDSARVADSASSVAWTNVSGRPTNVSSFTNDSGYLTASGTIANATSATQVVTIQDDPPAGVNGKLWWESDTGKLKVYYGSSSAWVDATPVPDMSLYYAKAGGPISGDVTIQQTLTVVGNTLIQGTLTETSDISLKENILPLESSLDKVMKLNGVSFNKKATPNVKEIGFIAQEVEAVIPDLVTETNEGIKTVSYSRVTAVLVETIKEQQAQIDAQNTQIEELKNMVNMLAEKLNNL
jgi:hypothetical protein